MGFLSKRFSQMKSLSLVCRIFFGQRRCKFHPENLPPSDMNSTCTLSKIDSVAPNAVPHSNTTEPVWLKRRDNEEAPQWRRPPWYVKGETTVAGKIHLKENQAT